MSVSQGLTLSGNGVKVLMSRVRSQRAPERSGDPELLRVLEAAIIANNTDVIDHIIGVKHEPKHRSLVEATSEWQTTKEGLTKRFTFPDRRILGAFITALKEEENVVNHHSDISTDDTSVVVTYTTHSAGDTVTELDHDCCELADEIAEQFTMRYAIGNGNNQYTQGGGAGDAEKTLTEVLGPKSERKKLNIDAIQKLSTPDIERLVNVYQNVAQNDASNTKRMSAKATTQFLKWALQERRGQPRAMGGAGSGNFGHAGRPGQQGGSSSDGDGGGQFDHLVGKRMSFVNKAVSGDSDVDPNQSGIFKGFDRETGMAIIEQSRNRAGDPHRRSVLVDVDELPAIRKAIEGNAKKILGSSARVDHDGTVTWRKEGGHPDAQLRRIEMKLEREGYQKIESHQDWAGDGENVTNVKTYRDKHGNTAEFSSYYGPTKDYNNHQVKITPNKKMKALGGPGSGNFGHSGRPGEQGGSADGESVEPERDKKLQSTASSLLSEIKRGMSYPNDDGVDKVQKVDGGYHFAVRDFGHWMVPPDEEDDGDYDWKIPTPQTAQRLDKIVSDFQARYPDMHIRWMNEGEKNWVGFDVLNTKKSTGRHLGGAGSGNFGHEGRPGERGGSAPAGEGGSDAETSAIIKQPSSVYMKANEGKTMLTDLGGLDTLSQYKTPDDKLTPERQRLHDAIVKEMTTGHNKPEGQPTAHLMGGGGASGKSVMQAQLDLPKDKIHVDVDVIRTKLPEWDEELALAKAEGRKPNAYLGSFTHEEASVISKRVIDHASKGGFNLMVDGAGDTSIEKVEQNVKRYSSGGQKVVANYVTVDYDIAYARMRERGDTPGTPNTGRYIPASHLREVHAEVARIFPQVVERGLFDEFALWDTTTSIKGPDGKISKPVKVASGTKNNITVHDQTAYDRFLAKGKGITPRSGEI